MILVNTTMGWSMGDDLIREGVLELLGVRGRPIVYIDRHILKGGQRLHQQSKAMPAPDALAGQAELLLVAGTPEWTDGGVAPWYDACAKRGVPIAIVGVGVAGNPSLLRRVRGLVVGATVRDEDARASLEAAGIPCERFLDPAFHAPYPAPAKAVGFVACFRAGADGWWARLAGARRPDVVTVHDAGELPRARGIFGQDAFFSSDWRGYLPIYASARAAVVGRIHAAVPLAACGATVRIAYGPRKVEALTMMRDAPGSTLTMQGYSDPPPAELGRVDPARSLEFIAADRAAHAAYWEGRLK